MKVHIADGNSKLGKIPNVSLRPVKDCVNCALCKKQCYALKAWKQYPNVRKAWSENSMILRRRPWEFFDAIERYLAKKNPEYFRWHVSGDVITREHGAGIVNLAHNFKRTKFLLFTKNLDAACWILTQFKHPYNLSTVVSVWEGNLPKRVEEAFPLAFAGDCSAYGSRFQKAIECPGKCDGCGVCWSLAKNGLDVKFRIH